MKTPKPILDTLARYMPNYYSSDDVARLNDLYKVVDEEATHSEALELFSGYGNLTHEQVESLAFEEVEQLENELLSAIFIPKKPNMETTNKMPFSNGTQFMNWKHENCDQCEIYESESTERDKAKCKYAFDLDFAQISCEIPISTLDYFGYSKYYNLANCPFLHCGRIKDYGDYEKAQKEHEKNKEHELPFEF